MYRVINQNNYPLRDWHFEHMQKTILKYVSGLTETEKHSSWKVKHHNNFDIHHGVTREEVTGFLDKVLSDSSFTDMRSVEGSVERIKELAAVT
jgi:hypothetical protein